MASTSQSPSTTVEATVTSKGQVTLLKELRNRLGIQNGSRIRFNIPSSGPVQLEPVLYDLKICGGWQTKAGNRAPLCPLRK